MVAVASVDVVATAAAAVVAAAATVTAAFESVPFVAVAAAAVSAEIIAAGSKTWNFDATEEKPAAAAKGPVISAVEGGMIVILEQTLMAFASTTVVGS